MYTFTDVAAETAGRASCVDPVSEPILRNQVMCPITDELDAVERLYGFHGLLQHLPVYCDVILGVEAKVPETEENLVRAYYGLPAKEIKVHAI